MQVLSLLLRPTSSELYVACKSAFFVTSTRTHRVIAKSMHGNPPGRTCLLVRSQSSRVSEALTIYLRLRCLPGMPSLNLRSAKLHQLENIRSFLCLPSNAQASH